MSMLIVCYLFFTGMGASALFAACMWETLTPYRLRNTELASTGVIEGISEVATVSHTFGLRSLNVSWFMPNDAYRGFFAPIYGAGQAAVLLGMLFLFADLGRPDRVLTIFTHPTLSFISIGAYLLAGLILCSLVSICSWVLSIPIPRVVAAAARVISLFFALAVMVYAGMFLASLDAVRFWHSVWLPLVFIASAMSTGLALSMGSVMLLGAPDRFATTLASARKIDAVLILLEIAILALLVIGAYNGTVESKLAVQDLLFGEHAAMFWVFVVVFGLIFPFFAELFSSDDERLKALFLIAVLIGGFFLRWCIVDAGSTPDLSLAAAVMFDGGGML